MTILLLSYSISLESAKEMRAQAIAKANELGVGGAIAVAMLLLAVLLWLEPKTDKTIKPL